MIISDTTLLQVELPFITEVYIGKRNPKPVKVSGQEIYNSNLNKFRRNAVVQALHDRFSLEILKHEKHPLFDKEGALMLSLQIFKNRFGWDVDNNWIWVKLFQDSLVHSGFLKSDSVKQINRVFISGHVIKDLKENYLRFTINI